MWPIMLIWKDNSWLFAAKILVQMETQAYTYVQQHWHSLGEYERIACSVYREGNTI